MIKESKTMRTIANRIGLPPKYNRKHLRGLVLKARLLKNVEGVGAKDEDFVIHLDHAVPAPGAPEPEPEFSLVGTRKLMVDTGHAEILGKSLSVGGIGFGDLKVKRAVYFNEHDRSDSEALPEDRLPK